MKFTALKEQLSERMARFQRRGWQERTLSEKLWTGSIVLIYMTVRELLRDRGAALAASLSFITVLSIVPLLSVATSLGAAFGVFASEDNMLVRTLQQVFPSAASGIVSYLGDLAASSAQAVGGVGGVSLVVIGVLLFNSIEQTLTNIWRGTHDRSRIKKFLTFYAMVTFGPVLIALSIIHTANVQIYLSRMGFDVSFVDRLLPLVYTLVAFTLMNKLLPHADVHWKSALIGGLFTAVAFELAKWGFNLYIHHVLLQAYNRIYGTMTLVPLFLVWVYITWFVILIGAEMAYSFQHLPSLMRAEAGERAALLRHGKLRVLNPVIAVEILAPIVDAFKRGQGAVSETQLVEKTEYNRTIIRETVNQLLAGGVLAETREGKRSDRRLLPARALEDIDLGALVESFWIQGGRKLGPAVRALSLGYRDATRAYFDGYVAGDLVDFTPEAGPKKEPALQADADSLSITSLSAGSPSIDTLIDATLEQAAEDDASSSLPENAYDP
ncbi:MAG: YihY/virulence factor BrkB family protein [Bradymonadaceae bacterium]|nr:YihY/virulence factor BrkB family protein [Lujinxingiaceae bacterium]